MKDCLIALDLVQTKSTMTKQQFWGKLLLKVMHYNIALLLKKVTNYVSWLFLIQEVLIIANVKASAWRKS